MSRGWLGALAMLTACASPGAKSEFAIYRHRDGMPMVAVPAGEFRVRYGNTDTSDHWYLPAFFIDAHEVTNAQFAKFLTDTRPNPAPITSDCLLGHAGGGWLCPPGAEDLPVVGITFGGAQAYARWVGASLPTFAQWEKVGGSVAREVAGPGLQAAPRAPRDARFGARGVFGNVAELALDIDGSPLVMGGSWRSAPVEPGMPSHGTESIGADDVGFRCVLDLPRPEPGPRVEWRRDFWEAVDEARRRNAILFVTLHWDGCGNCDRFRHKICEDPGFIAYVNRHVVPVVGQSNVESIMGPHASLPDGRCWIFPGLTCAEHRWNFRCGLNAVLDFPMSPGHAILTPAVGPAPTREEFVLVPDEQLPDEGTAQFWIQTFKEQQAKLGAAMRVEEFRRLPPREEPAASEAFAAGRYREALEEARAAGAEGLVLKIERLAWDLWMEGRAYWLVFKQRDEARKRFEQVVEVYAGSAVAERAKKDLEELR